MLPLDEKSTYDKPPPLVGAWGMAHHRAVGACNYWFKANAVNVQHRMVLWDAKGREQNIYATVVQDGPRWERTGLRVHIYYDLHDSAPSTDVLKAIIDSEEERTGSELEPDEPCDGQKFSLEAGASMFARILLGFQGAQFHAVREKHDVPLADGAQIVKEIASMFSVVPGSDSEKYNKVLGNLETLVNRLGRYYLREMQARVSWGGAYLEQRHTSPNFSGYNGHYDGDKMKDTVRAVLEDEDLVAKTMYVLNREPQSRCRTDYFEHLHACVTNSDHDSYSHCKPVALAMLTYCVRNETFGEGRTPDPQTEAEIRASWLVGAFVKDWHLDTATEEMEDHMDDWEEHYATNWSSSAYDQGGAREDIKRFYRNYFQCMKEMQVPYKKHYCFVSAREHLVSQIDSRR